MEPMSICEPMDTVDPTREQESCRTVTSFVETLPPDTLDCICSFLVLENLGCFTAASKRLYHLLKESCSSLYMSDSSGTISSKGLRCLLQRYHQLNILHLCGLANVGDCLFDILNRSQSSTTLQEISLKGCHLSYWCRSSLNLQNLTSLKITGGSIRVSIGSFLLGRGAESTNLRHLVIGQCSSLQDTHLANLVDSNLQHQLESLALIQCLRVKTPALKFHNLCSLRLMACYSLEALPDFDCPSLTELTLTFCFRLPGKTIQEIVNQTAPKLQKLTLSKCSLLDRLEVYSDTLQTLNIGLNNHMESVVLVCNRLKVLETTCTSITSLCLVSAQLQTLNLCSMLSLEQLKLHSLSLQQLRLAGCENLSDEHCEVHCPALRAVDVCGTTLNIERFGIQQIEAVFVQQCPRTAAVPIQ